jgi:hypothetical protein
VTYPSMLTILVKEKEAGRLQIEPVVFNTGGETLGMASLRFGEARKCAARNVDSTTDHDVF